MGRLVLIEFIVFLGAFAVSWLLRKLLGRIIRGWKVGIWGMLFGVVGAILTGLLLQTLSFDVNFLDLEVSGLNIAVVAVRYFGLTALLGGFLGAIVASFGRRKKKVLAPEPSQLP